MLWGRTTQSSFPLCSSDEILHGLHPPGRKAAISSHLPGAEKSSWGAVAVMSVLWAANKYRQEGSFKCFGVLPCFQKRCISRLQSPNLLNIHIICERRASRQFQNHHTSYSSMAKHPQSQKQGNKSQLTHVHLQPRRPCAPSNHHSTSNPNLLKGKPTLLTVTQPWELLPKLSNLLTC